MADVSGSTGQYSYTGNNVAATTTFQLMNMGTTVDVDLVGLTSDNDGTFKNTSGSEVTINGRLTANYYNTGVNGFLISAATSSDKVTWTPQSSAAWKFYGGNFGRQVGHVFHYKITVPAGHYLGVMVKTVSGSGTFQTTSPCHVVSSDEGAEETPLLDAKCSYANASVSYGQTSTSSYAAVNTTASEFAGSVGATVSNGRITNNTGETITVDGYFKYVSRGAGGISITYQHQIYKNTSSLATGSYNSYGMTSGVRISLISSYSVELAPGDYIECRVKKFSRRQFSNI